MKILHVVGALSVLGLTAGCSPGFTSTDIDKMKETIKSEFEKREGVSVVEVVMIKESSTKVTGFVKLKLPVFGEITKPCSATMGEDNRYIWRCD